MNRASSREINRPWPLVAAFPGDGGKPRYLKQKGSRIASNTLFTSLYAASKNEQIHYYYTEIGNWRLYTDVMLTG